VEVKMSLRFHEAKEVMKFGDIFGPNGGIFGKRGFQIFQPASDLPYSDRGPIEGEI
jgi:hypothetical protein